MIRFFEDNQEIPVIWDLSIEDDIKYLGRYKNPKGEVSLNLFLNGGFRQYHLNLGDFSLVMPEEKYYKVKVYKSGASLMMDKRFVRNFIRKMRKFLYKDCSIESKEDAAIALMKLLFQSSQIQGVYSYNTDYPRATRKWVDRDFCVHFDKDYFEALKKIF